MSQTNLKITRFVSAGELTATHTDTASLLDELGSILDGNNATAWDVFGDVVFVAEDGKEYTIEVSAILVPTQPEAPFTDEETLLFAEFEQKVRQNLARFKSSGALSGEENPFEVMRATLIITSSEYHFRPKTEEGRKTQANLEHF
jgi:hypothetical protein